MSYVRPYPSHYMDMANRKRSDSVVYDLWAYNIDSYFMDNHRNKRI